MACGASLLRLPDDKQLLCCGNSQGLTCCLQGDTDSTHHCFKDGGLSQTLAKESDAIFSLNALIQSVNYIR